ncbi:MULTISPECIES: hypothetical protein [Rhizobium]|uniref:hypothetical protein n=1 Tax=Rhizobium phaseoli TaxID=396 RepID=UPI000A1C06FE|nr:hypothetical protein [Rhizobium phaseoli]ARM12078.1 hypothetical protein Bra5_CH01841 [Rhizobium phaseoli Brasil 5]
MATEAEKRKLEQIRQDLATVGADWAIEADGASLSLVVRDPVDGGARAIAAIAADAPFALQDFLIRAGERQQFLLDMIERCSRAYRQLLDKQPKPKRYAAECAMKCRNDQAFRQFLIERHGLRDATDFERIKTKMHFILRIESLNDLDTDEAAAGRWKEFRAAFERWRRNG